jgi:WD40 repeat protein
MAHLPYICSVSFDRSGEAISIGTSDKQVHIYDVQKQ